MTSMKGERQISELGATGKRRWELTCLVRTSSKQGLESRIVNLSTKTGGFAADLLQVQPLATIGSIHDCRLEHTNRTTWMMPGRAAANKRRCSASICRPASPWDAVWRCTMDHCLCPSLTWRTGDRTAWWPQVRREMEPDRFHDRREAGLLLAAKLAAYANRADVIVLALPRGGVPVAYEVARALGAPLDVFV